MRSTQRDYKHFEKKVNPPYTKPLPICKDLVEGEYIGDFADRMMRVRDWHQNELDRISPNDKVFARNIPRHTQVVADINKLLVSLA